MGWQIQNPPRNGEVADAKRLTEGAHLSASDAHDGKVGPLHHPADGPPPRSGEDLAETRTVAGWVLDQILVMLHPFMPFVTEELWHAQGQRECELIVAKWPEPGAVIDDAAKAEVEWLIALISGIRTAKNELGIPPGAKLPAYCETPSALGASVMKGNMAAIERLARLSVEIAPALQGAAMQVIAGADVFVIPLEGVVDLDAEKARLSKALETSTKEAKSLSARLANPAFVERAKPEAVEKARADHAHHAAEVERLEAALGRLG